MKNRTPPAHTFQQFNDDINDLFRHLKETNHSNAEIRAFFSPLKTRPTQFKTAAIFATLTLISTVYLLTYFETFSWHLSAVARIFLIKMLPYWDWTALKNQKCLITKPVQPNTAFEYFANCDVCENIQQVDVYESISGELLKMKYIDVDVPVVVKTTTAKWPQGTSVVEDAARNELIGRSTPCRLSTNIHNGGPTSVGNLIAKARLFDSFFLHFQNCDFEVMKQFRGFTPRPPFLPPELAPVHYNWLLWSFNYNVTRFKAIGLVGKVAVVGQLSGGNEFELTADACEEECLKIGVELGEGEALIVTGLWSLTYRPRVGENVAVILEIR